MSQETANTHTPKGRAWSLHCQAGDWTAKGITTNKVMSPASQRSRKQLFGKWTKIGTREHPALTRDPAHLVP